MATRKLVVVPDYGALPELGGISGPISTPTKITIKAIKAMIIRGRTVMECDPKDPQNTEKRIRLDISNVTSENFGREERLISEELHRLEELVNSTEHTNDQDTFRTDEGTPEEPGDTYTEKVEAGKIESLEESETESETEQDSVGDNTLKNSDVYIRDETVETPEEVPQETEESDVEDATTPADGAVVENSTTPVSGEVVEQTETETASTQEEVPQETKTEEAIASASVEVRNKQEPPNKNMTIPVKQQNQDKGKNKNKCHG